MDHSWFLLLPLFCSVRELCSCKYQNGDMLPARFVELPKGPFKFEKYEYEYEKVACMFSVASSSISYFRSSNNFIYESFIFGNCQFLNAVK